MWLELILNVILFLNMYFAYKNSKKSEGKIFALIFVVHLYAFCVICITLYRMRGYSIYWYVCICNLYGHLNQNIAHNCLYDIIMSYLNTDVVVLVFITRYLYEVILHMRLLTVDCFLDSLGTGLRRMG